MKHRHWSPGTLMAQAYRDIANEHNATVDALEAALAVPPIRVPFSDAVIEKMARAACDGFGLTSQGMWGVSSHNQKEAWKQSIRAALAAGGIEPCAVPQYAPEDVAFPSERASDEELAVLAHNTFNGTSARRIDSISQAVFADDWVACAAAVRSRVEVPLLAEIARLEREAKSNIEWQETMVLDMRNKDAQLKAVTAERDENAAELSRLQSIALVPDEAGEQLAALRQTVDADAWKTDIDVAWLTFREADRQIILVDNTRAMGAIGSLSPCDAARAAQWLASYAAAHGCPVGGAIQYKRNPALRQPVDATPTDAQVEALARVIEAAYSKDCGVAPSEAETLGSGWYAEARAAYSHIGRVPVGAELDVTADVIEVIARSSSRQTRAKEILDLCRSRIKPVYECKECRQWRNANNELVRRADAARAAMKGE